MLGDGTEFQQQPNTDLVGDETELEQQLTQLQQQLHTHKDLILEKFTHALREAGLPHVALHSVSVFVNVRERTCPEGTELVWVSVQQPDGTVRYERHCK
jgi:hypothetical protein